MYIWVSCVCSLLIVSTVMFSDSRKEQMINGIKFIRAALCSMCLCFLMFYVCCLCFLMFYVCCLCCLVFYVSKFSHVLCMRFLCSMYVIVFRYVSGVVFMRAFVFEVVGEEISKNLEL
jgi:hypothetical protein